MTDGLKNVHREAIIAKIAANRRVERAVLFGSRATGTNTVSSDVDIALFGDRLTLTDQARLAAALDEIPMAQSVDLLLYNSIQDRTLREHIWNQGIELFARSSHQRSKWDTSSTTTSWLETRLGDVVRLMSGGTPSKKRKAYWNGAIPWVSAKDMKLFRINDTTHHVTAEGIANGTKLVPAGTILLLTRGMRLLKELPVCVVERPMAFNQDVKALLPKTQIDPVFLPYLILGHRQHLHDLVDLAGHGTGRINSDELRAVKIRLPPTRKQRAIAHVLGTLDDKIELNRRMNETLEAMARALFKSWFVDFDPVRAKMEDRDTGLPPDIADLFPDRLVDSEIGKIPDRWTVAPLRELLEVNPKRSLRRGQIAPYLPMANMPTQGHVPNSFSVRPFGSGTRFANGDTLVARITPCLENGKTAFVDFLGANEIGWGSTEYIVLRPRPPLSNHFGYCLARSAGFREFAIQNMSGTSGRQRVPVSALKGFLMVAPQAQLSAQFGEVAELLFERANRADRESRTLATLRDTLLPKLISGEIRVQDAERALESVT